MNKLPGQVFKPNNNRKVNLIISKSPTIGSTLVDFVSKRDVFLHLEFDIDLEIVELNDYVQSEWREPHRLRLRQTSGQINEVEITFGEFSATIKFWDGQAVTFDSDFPIGNFEKMLATLNVECVAGFKNENTLTTYAHEFGDVESDPAPKTSPSLEKDQSESIFERSTTDITEEFSPNGFLSHPIVELDDPLSRQEHAPSHAINNVRPQQNIPPYVHEVCQEFETVNLRPIARAIHPLPDRWSPILISVVKNEIDKIHDFFRHYRRGGIERFCFIDNGSSDGTLDYLRSQPDTDVYERLGNFDWKLKQGWITRALATYGLNRWFIYADADEHIVFDDFGMRPFSDLTFEMDKMKILRVRGFLIDMYADCPILNSTYNTHSRLQDAYPFYDRESYMEERYKEIISVTGGPRARLFGEGGKKFRPELTKYPLFCLHPGEYMASPHHIWPYAGNFDSKRYLGILHYKFLPNAIDRIKSAVEAKNYWDGSFEYERYLDVISKDASISFMNPFSREYKGPKNLVRDGLLAGVNWSKDLTKEEAAFRSALLKTRSELMGTSGLSKFLACVD